MVVLKSKLLLVLPGRQPTILKILRRVRRSQRRLARPDYSEIDPRYDAPFPKSTDAILGDRNGRRSWRSTGESSEGRFFLLLMRVEAALSKSWRRPARSEFLWCVYCDLGQVGEVLARSKRDATRFSPLSRSCVMGGSLRIEGIGDVARRSGEERRTAAERGKSRRQYQTKRKKERSRSFRASVAFSFVCSCAHAKLMRSLWPFVHVQLPRLVVVPSNLFAGGKFTPSTLASQGRR